MEALGWASPLHLFQCQTEESNSQWRESCKGQALDENLEAEERSAYKGILDARQRALQRKLQYT
jgi:hypothetical protein